MALSTLVYEKGKATGAGARKLALPLTGLYAICVGLSTLQDGFTQDVANGQIKRNMSSFNAMADVKLLNHPARPSPWEKRQENITRNILDSNRGSPNWLIVNTVRKDLISLMDNANIAVVPNKTFGAPTMLVIDQEHGCLVVDPDKDEKSLAKESTIVLDEFIRASSKQIDPFGTYTLQPDGARTYSIAGTASDYCPKPHLKAETGFRFGF